MHWIFKFWPFSFPFLCTLLLELFSYNFLLAKLFPRPCEKFYRSPFPFFIIIFNSIGQCWSFSLLQNFTIYFISRPDVNSFLVSFKLLAIFFCSHFCKILNIEHWKNWLSYFLKIIFDIIFAIYDYSD